MERKRTYSSEQYREKYQEKFDYEQDQSIRLGVYDGRDLPRFRDELVELRRATIGETAQTHQEWVERISTSNYLGFLCTHKEKVVSMLIGMKVTPDWLSPTIREYLQTYSCEAPDRQVLWIPSVMTHPDYQEMGLAKRSLLEFSEYSESHYRMTGAYLICRINQHNFASEFLFAGADFKPTGLFDLEDIGDSNFKNFQFWIKVIPPLYSKEAEVFLPPERRQQLQESDAPYYLP